MSTIKSYITFKTMLSLLMLMCVLSLNLSQAQNLADSLTFIYTNTNQKVVLTKGMLLEVKTKDRQKLIGEFIGGSESELLLKQKDKTHKLAIANTNKIVIYKEGSKDPITGSVRFVVSASRYTSLILGAGAAAGGIATVSNNKALGIGLIGVSIPLIYYGIKLHFMLKNADRDVIKMNKGWTVSRSS